LAIFYIPCFAIRVDIVPTEKVATMLLYLHLLYLRKDTFHWPIMWHCHSYCFLKHWSVYLPQAFEMFSDLLINSLIPFQT